MIKQVPVDFKYLYKSSQYFFIFCLKDFFPKLATELQKGFVYKELDNGDKLKVVKISNDEAMILAEDEWF